MPWLLLRISPVFYELTRLTQVLHPFYIFQIASLVLWSLDSYYYYAVCIFTMSVASITATLIETRAVSWRIRAIQSVC